MKSNQRRPRSRGNGKRHSGRNHSFESSGPEGKIRGTAQQVFDKYQALGRDASSSGDRVAAEGYFQHAEHYFRIIATDTRTNGGARNEGEQAQKSEADATDTKDTKDTKAATDATGATEAVEVPITKSEDDKPAPDQAQV